VPVCLPACPPSCAQVATTCKLIKGDDSNGQFKRTVVRTDLDRIGLPVFYLCLGARTSSNDLTGCSPITTLDQVVFVLKKRTQCDAAFIAAAREQATAYLTTPTPTSPTQAAPIFSLRGACVDAALLVSEGVCGRGRLWAAVQLVWQQA
jgi:hypothetical protein